MLCLRHPVSNILLIGSIYRLQLHYYMYLDSFDVPNQDLIYTPSLLHN